VCNSGTSSARIVEDSSVHEPYETRQEKQQLKMLNMEDVPPPGTALVEELDKRLLVQLRDGRKLVGILRSFDQFAI